MSADAWQTGYARCLGVELAGDLIGDSDERGEPLWGDSILLLMNAHYEAMPFTIPTRGEGEPWERLLDTADPTAAAMACPAGQPYALQGRSMVVLRTPAPPQEERPSVTTATAAPEDGASDGRPSEAARR